jgi:hypothetical protein
MQRGDVAYRPQARDETLEVRRESVVMSVQEWVSAKPVFLFEQRGKRKKF